jgi:flagellar FliL protein
MAEPAPEAAPAPEPKGGGMGGKIVNGVGIFVLCLVAVIAGGYVNAILHPGPQFEMTPEGQLTLKKEVDAHGKPATGAPKPAIYYAFDPPFVVSFEDEAAVRFLQVQVEVMAREQPAIDAVQQHAPVIRNNLLNVINARDYKTLLTTEGKEKLRQECLAETQKVLKKETGSPGIEDLYFTSFVVQ